MEMVALVPATPAVTIELAPSSFRQEIARNGSGWVELAGRWQITDQASYDRVVEWLLAIAALKEMIVDRYRESKSLANRTHERICQDEHEDLNPLEQSEALFKQKVAAWDDSQRELRKEDQRLRRAAARAAGSSWLPLPQVMVPSRPTYTPSDAILHGSKRWKAEVWDIRLLCRAIADGQVSPMYVEPAQSRLNTLANAEGTALNVPGVRAVPDTNPNVRVNRRKNP